MNRLPNETLIDFTLRYLRAHTAGKRFQQAPPRTSPPRVSSQCEAEVLGGGPQPAVRLLDNSEDIAEEYSRPISNGMPQRKGSADRQCSKAPVSAQNSRDFPKTEDRFSGRESGEGKVRVQGKVGTTALPAFRPVSELAADAVSGNLQVRGREISGESIARERNRERTQPAPESPKAMLCSILDLPCETVVEVNRKGVLECRGQAVGICKHCGLPVCLSCVKWEFCSMASRHQVIVQ